MENQTESPKETKHTPVIKSQNQQRLHILHRALIGVGIGLFISVIVICFFAFYEKETPSALTVLITVLGNVLTTIVGVIAGTSIDK